jgi:hypothetical protein
MVTSREATGATDTNKQRYILMENVTRKKILGRHTILRKRSVVKLPANYRKMKCFHSFDFGYWTLYVEKSKPAKKVNISINDK